ncbi:MAG: hypothetical protein JWQ33_442, partial [Ramlibacter sp.]|nr:hypothetical protein [Ramlibacter sp.]
MRLNSIARNASAGLLLAATLSPGFAHAQTKTLRFDAHADDKIH